MGCPRQAIFSTSVSLIALTLASGPLRYIRVGAEPFAGMPQRLACLPTQCRGIMDHGGVGRRCRRKGRDQSLDTSLT